MARKQTLMRYMVQRVGRRNGYRLMAFIIGWEAARSEVGDEMSVDDYADWWKLSRAQAFRDQSLFRECFADQFATPSALIDLAKSQRVAVQHVRFS